MGRYGMPSHRQIMRDVKRRGSQPGITVTAAEMEYRINHYEDKNGEHHFVGWSDFCVWCRKRTPEALADPVCEFGGAL